MYYQVFFFNKKYYKKNLEIPEEWNENIKKWIQINSSYKIYVNNIGFVPLPNEEYLLYQILVGSWPFESHSIADNIYIQRICDYIKKAIKVSFILFI